MEIMENLSRSVHLVKELKQSQKLEVNHLQRQNKIMMKIKNLRVNKFHMIRSLI